MALKSAKKARSPYVRHKKREYQYSTALQNWRKAIIANRNEDANYWHHAWCQARERGDFDVKEATGGDYGKTTEDQKAA